MDKYIKMEDLIELINHQQKEIDEEYNQGKICFSSNIINHSFLFILTIMK